jgi:hypothetical protein
MQIRVIRGNGDRIGPNIVNSLLTDNSIAREKGTWAINDSTSKKVENANCPLLSFQDTGLLAEVTTKKEKYKGKITFFSQTIDIDKDAQTFFPASSLRIQRVVNEDEQ